MMFALLIVAPISGRLILSETLRRIYWTKVPTHTKVLIGHCGRQGASLYPNGAPLDLLADEEYRILLPFIKQWIDAH